MTEHDWQISDKAVSDILVNMPDEGREQWVRDVLLIGARALDVVMWADIEALATNTDGSKGWAEAVVRRLDIRHWQVQEGTNG